MAREMSACNLFVCNILWKVNIVTAVNCLEEWYTTLRTGDVSFSMTYQIIPELLAGIPWIIRQLFDKLLHATALCTIGLDYIKDPFIFPQNIPGHWKVFQELGQMREVATCL